jgi:superfamily II DNA or RNA helicase
VGIIKRVIVRETNFKLPEELGRQPAIHVVWQHLIQDANRNEAIVKDVLCEIEAQRTPLVISERTEHLHTLCDLIKSDGQKETHVFLMEGVTGKKERQKIVSGIRAAIENKEPLCLVATSSLIGEGFDLPELDTLFLAMPLSFKGRVVQYAGRLHRQHAGKHEIRIYDYLHTSSGLTIKMYRNRLRAYESMGYGVEEKSQLKLSDPS